MAPTVEQLIQTLAAIIELPAGISEVETLSRSGHFQLLRGLTVVQLSGNTRPSSPDEEAYIIRDVVEEAVQHLRPTVKAMAEALIGLGNESGAGKGIRFGAARRHAKSGGHIGDFIKTVRPQVVRAVATELHRLEVEAERRRLHQVVDPRVRERLETYLEATRAHLAHLTVPLPHLPIRARIAASPMGLHPSTENPVEILNKWLALDHPSNLAVVLGTFGSGKTSCLVEFTDQLLTHNEHRRIPLFTNYRHIAPRTVHAREDVPLLTSSNLAALYFTPGFDDNEPLARLLRHVSESVVIIDGFDELWGTPQISVPDLHNLAHLLRPPSKVLLSARRHFSMADDPFIGQLREPSSYYDTGVIDPLILELEPPSIDDIRQALTSLDAGEAIRLLNYLSAYPPEQVEHLFKPLLLQMLLLIPDLDAKKRAISVADLYRRYTTLVLARDFDQGVSAIPGSTKRWALIALSGDVLLGDRSVPDVVGDRLHLSHDSVSLRVLEAVNYTPGLNVAEPALDRPRDSSRDWTRDFTYTNHLLVTTRAMRWVVPRHQTFEFSHPTFFELFAAEYLLQAASNRQAFGLAESSHTERLFDSLIPYFLKANVDSILVQHVTSVAVRENLGHLDRLLCVFLLEDELDLPSVLHEMPNDYLQYLRLAEERGHSFFLTKVIKYQLVLAERSNERAYKYVDFVRKYENRRHRDLEDHLLSTIKPAEDFLLDRLRRPHLQTAQAITVYRLGQMGGMRARERLGELLQEIKDPIMLKLITEAIMRIDARTGAQR